MNPRPVLAVTLAVAGFGFFVTNADAFSRVGCFVSPTAQHSIASLFDQVDAALSNHGPSESRACEYYARGLLYHLQRNYTRAIADYSSALGWMSEYGDVYAARGDAYADMGRQSDAAHDYALAAQYSNDAPGEFTERCWIRALRGRPLPLALEDCNASLKAMPDELNTLTSRCLVYYRMGNYAAALSDCGAALKQKPQNVSALYIQALAKLRSGDTAGGNADFAAARALSDRVADTFAIYGVRP